MQERLFTINQVAELLATTHREVLHWIAKGWLTGKPGPDGTDRVSEKALIHFLKGRGVDIMQLLASTAVHHAGRAERAGGGPQSPAGNDRPAVGQAGLSSPPAPKADPRPAPADDAKLLDLDKEAACPRRPRVLSARNGPAGPSLDEEVATALAAREMLTGRHVPSEPDEPAPLPSLGLAPPRQPRPPAPATAPAALAHEAVLTPAAPAKAALPVPAAAADANKPAKARPGQLLNDDEVAALLGAPPGQPVRNVTSPDTAADDGPFVGEVDEIEPDDDAGIDDPRDEKPLSQGQAVVPPLEGPKPDRDSRAALPSPAEQASAQAAQVLSAVLDDAVRRGATHVHMHCRRAGLALLIRLAGRLIDKPNFRRMEAWRAKALVGRLMDLAGLAGADLSRPRSGEFTHTADGRAVRMTLSSFPTADGPRLVISLPARLQEQLDLAALGARPAEAERIRDLLAARGGGLLLVCGPTRHDRDDVLAALAGQLAGTGRDVLAIGAGNSPVDPVGGYSFRDAARHLAGQDADAIILAELRDPTTATAALEAALAGAMVVAGAAAETAAEALGMLAEMGVESWPMAAMFRGAIVCRKLPRLGPARGTSAKDGNVRLISLLEPSRELVRLVRAAAPAEAITTAVPGAGPAARRDIAAGAVHDGYLSADDAARLS